MIRWGWVVLLSSCAATVNSGVKKAEPACSLVALPEPSGRAFKEEMTACQPLLAQFFKAHPSTEIHLVLSLAVDTSGHVNAACLQPGPPKDARPFAACALDAFRSAPTSFRPGSEALTISWSLHFVPE